MLENIMFNAFRILFEVGCALIPEDTKQELSDASVWHDAPKEKQKRYSMKELNKKIKQIEEEINEFESSKTISDVSEK